MKIVEHINLPLEQFKNYFESLNNIDKFTCTEDGWNVLQWSLYKCNPEVSKYLLNQYKYDLRSETSLICNNGGTLLQMLPFVYMHEDNIHKINVDDYKAMLTLLVENKIIIEPFSYKELSKWFGNKIANIFNPDFFQVILENNYISNKTLNQLLPKLMLTNIKGFFISKEIAKLVIEKDNFIPVVNNINDFIKICENLENIKNLSEEKLNIFTDKVLSSFLNNNKMNVKFIKDLHLAIVKQKLINNEREKNNPDLDIEVESALYKGLSITNSYAIQLLLYTVICDFQKEKTQMADIEIPFNNEILDLIIKNKDISLYTEVKNKVEDPLFSQRFEKAIEKSLLANPTYNFDIRDYEKFNNRWNEDFSDEVLFNANEIIQYGVDILKAFEDHNTPLAYKIRCNWLAYYLSIHEEIKIDTSLSEYTELNHYMKQDFNFIDIMVKRNLNLIIDSKVIETPINTINHYKLYRTNVIEKPSDIENNTYGLLKIILNSKMSFSEINKVISEIKGNEDFNVEFVIKTFIKKNSKSDLSFLIYEASSTEKLELLLNNGVKFPEKMDEVKVLHNIILNNDETFFDKIGLNKKEISTESLEIFLRNMACYNIKSSDRGEDFKRMLMENNVYKTLFELMENNILKLNEDAFDTFQKYLNHSFLNSSSYKDYLFSGCDDLEISIVNKELINIEEKMSQIEKKYINELFNKNVNIIINKRRM